MTLHHGKLSLLKAFPPNGDCHYCLRNFDVSAWVWVGVCTFFWGFCLPVCEGGQRLGDLANAVFSSG